MGIKFEKSMQEIGSQIAELILSSVPISIVYGEVISVNEDNYTFDVSTTDTNEIRDIPLKGVENGATSLLLIPSIGSLVIVGFVENNPSLSFPILFTEVDNIYISVGDSTINIEGDNISFNGGDSPLIYIEKLTEKLNDFINIFNNHTHKIPLGTVITSAQGGILNTTPIELSKTENTANDFSQDYYSDEKITH